MNEGNAIPSIGGTHNVPMLGPFWVEAQELAVRFGILARRLPVPLATRAEPHRWRLHQEAYQRTLDRVDAGEDPLPRDMAILVRW